MDTEQAIGTGEGVAIGFKSMFNVAPDKVTGKVIGWEDFFAHIDSVSGEDQKEIDKYKNAKDDVKATYIIEKTEGNLYSILNQ